jgi:feruloyl esterase
MLGAMERWVEDGQAAERIVASRVTAGRVDRTRPLYHYPKQAVYAGSGSIDEEENLVCR